MSDNLPVDPSTLSEKGTRGVMSTIAGASLLAVNALLGVPVLGTLISLGLTGLGALGLFGKSKTDKVSGGVLTAAGIAGLSTLVLPGLARGLLSLGGIGLLGFGIYNLATFLIGLRKHQS
ncbi:MAG: hypothetical protein WHT81_01580 [Rectinemataceae bacterium]|nr:hypothetical protein [Spirochaetaceae bacterium]MDH7483418.1 hypothetical protein [Spirochaetales bacterium]